MVKVLIVEDHRLTLDYLINDIPWSEHEVEVVGSAYNGQKALDFIAENQVDLVITDIRMPVMNGLELLRELNKTEPRIKSIILTAHDDFSYAKEAIRYGVSDFVLKPINDEKLLDVVHSIRDKVYREKEVERDYESLKQDIVESLPLLRRDFFRKLAEGYYEDEYEIRSVASLFHIEFPYSHVAVHMFCIDDFRQNVMKLPLKQRELLMLALQKRLEDNLLQSYQGFSIIEDDRIVAFYSFAEAAIKKTSMSGEPSGEVPQSLLDNIAEFQLHIKRKYNLTLSVGLSTIKNGLIRFSACYQEASRAINRRFFNGKGSLIDSATDVTDMEKYYIPVSFQKKIVDATVSGNKNELEMELDRLFHFIKLNPDLQIMCVKDYIHNVIFQTLVLLKEAGLITMDTIRSTMNSASGIEKAETLEDLFSQLLQNLLSDLSHIVNERISAKEDFPIKKAMHYIGIHFAEPLTVEKVAGVVRLNPCYFSHLFGKITGTSFCTYILDVRMKKALELIKNPGTSIKEIAYSTGFKDPKYFSKLFKEHTGESPSEYRSGVSAEVM